jgi:hypothetical protein
MITCYAQPMRRVAQTEEEIEAERQEFMKAWEKAKMNSPFFTPKVPDEKPRED